MLLYSRRAKWGGRKTKNKSPKSCFGLLESMGFKTKPLEIADKCRGLKVCTNTAPKEREADSSLNSLTGLSQAETISFQLPSFLCSAWADGLGTEQQQRFRRWGTN